MLVYQRVPTLVALEIWSDIEISEFHKRQPLNTIDQQIKYTFNRRSCKITLFKRYIIYRWVIFYCHPFVIPNRGSILVF